MSASEKAMNIFLDVVNELSPDIDSIYVESHNKDLSEWSTLQKSMVGASGAASMVLPGLHLVGMAADIAFVLNRMSVASLGVGAIIGNQTGAGNILEQEDFAAVLGYWCDDEGIQHAMKGKGSASATKLTAKLASKAFTKGLAKTMLASSGYLIGQRLGGKAMGKAAAKFAGKFAGKAVGGFIPFVGPIVSGGVNVWLLTGIIDASKRYYADKAALVT
jgi:hypothetical protein